MALIAAAFTHYVYGGLQLQARGERTTQRRPHAPAVLLAALVLVRAGTLLARPLLAGDQGLQAAHRHHLHRRPRGAARPRRSSRWPPLMTAALFIASIWTHSWRLPVVGVALLLDHLDRRRRHLPGARTSASRSSPRRSRCEQAYIDRNIKATRAAYGLDGRADPAYDGDARRPPAASCATTPTPSRASAWSTRSWSRPTFKQLQSVKSYYAFPDALDVDRYSVDGKRQRHRHRRARARPRRRAGQPAQLAQRPHGLHPRLRCRRRLRQPARRRRPAGLLRAEHPAGRASSATFEPRIYFGEQSPDYSIVGGADGQPPARVRLPGQQRGRPEATPPTPARAACALGSFAAQGSPTRSSTAS